MQEALALISANAFYIVIIFIGSAFGSLAGIPRFVNAVREWRAKARAKKISASLSAATGVASYTSDDISYACRNYIAPNCTQTDPSDEDDLRSVVALAPLFTSIDQHFDTGGQKRHVILLADSGMGKTSFCINYYAREFRKRPAKRRAVAIVPLGRGDALDQIKAIPDKRNTICFLDAFDEDPQAVQNQEGRLEELMLAASDFRNIVITCRSQFFSKDDTIPRGSGIMYAAPRKAGQSRELPLHRLFLAPFSAIQINSYLKKQFPITKLGSLKQRKIANEMVATIPELSARPMLLELVPDLIREKRSIGELFGLYEYLVEKWLERESEWIEKNDLRGISVELAVIAYLQQRSGNGDRLPPALLERLASEHSTSLEGWKLKSRSLLNRDIEGQFKFAHRSVMEYLFLLAAISGDERCFAVEWTDLMKDLLVSWGNSYEMSAPNLGANILSRDHSATGLYPLASPLKQPQRRSIGECRTILRKEGVSFRQSRSIPVAWRNQSLKVLAISSQGSVSAFEIYDSTHALCWLVSDVTSLKETTERAIYRDIYDPRPVPISAKLHHIDSTLSNFKRLPSIEEMLCLWESEPFIVSNHRLNRIFDTQELYWLGDSGDTGPLCCSFGEKPYEVPHLRLHSSRIEQGNRTMHLYEFQGRYGLLNRLPFKAMCVYVVETAV